MNFIYEPDPLKIEEKSFQLIRQQTDLSGFDKEQTQVVMRIIHCVGLPDVATKVRFSKNACKNGLKAIQNKSAILCDVEMVKQGVTKRLIDSEPLCFLNHPDVPALAKKIKNTRTMAAMKFWQPYLKDSIVIIGNAPTALFGLLQKIKDGGDKPALIIGMPVGFVGAAESKDALWDHCEELGIECITLLGKQGGSAVASATCNALLRCHVGMYF
ncbi:MAG: precorrin-8X methylmutase [Saccharospirillaceae bacterium]|nr:precorrin-8X methylmutase [Pseudomonadales bacterium]NRB78064.1 precorrin-8X methylmutase [Saccharospirillaceae bacterium]